MMAVAAAIRVEIDVVTRLKPRTYRKMATSGYTTDVAGAETTAGTAATNKTTPQQVSSSNV
jgi:hypothetical protein